MSSATLVVASLFDEERWDEAQVLWAREMCHDLNNRNLEGSVSKWFFTIRREETDNFPFAETFLLIHDGKKMMWIGPELQGSHITRNMPPVAPNETQVLQMRGVTQFWKIPSVGVAGSVQRQLLVTGWKPFLEQCVILFVTLSN